MSNKITHIKEFIDKNKVKKDLKCFQSEVVLFSEDMTYESLIKTAAAIEFASPIFKSVSPNGIELVKLIGNGNEKNNHHALLSFIKNLQITSFECDESEHYEVVSYELSQFFINNDVI